MFKRFQIMAVLLGLAASPVLAASSVSVVNGSCVSLSTGCLFTGNIGPNTVADTQAAYNSYNNNRPGADPDINLMYLFKSDDGNLFKGSFTGKDSSSGSWSTPGYVIDYIAIKAANNFVLFKVGTSVSSGSWNTLLIPYNRNPHDLSHLAFFGQSGDIGVPEPASWAMMIIGFGFVGSALRRRDGRSTVAARG